MLQRHQSLNHNEFILKPLKYTSLILYNSINLHYLISILQIVKSIFGIRRG
jgi:hypothetical protein